LPARCRRHCVVSESSRKVLGNTIYKRLTCVRMGSIMWRQVERQGDRREASGMFRGGFAHSVDEKGRVIVPQKFRLLLGEKFVVTKGLDRCLWVFPDEEFRKLDAHLNSQPMLDPNAVRLQRFFSGEAMDASSDAQGRVALPSNLRDYACIEKEVTIIGAGNRIEIWSKAGWDSMDASMTDEGIRQSAREIGLGGIG